MRTLRSCWVSPFSFLTGSGDFGSLDDSVILNYYILVWNDKSFIREKKHLVMFRGAVICCGFGRRGSGAEWGAGEDGEWGARP